MNNTLNHIEQLKTSPASLDPASLDPAAVDTTWIKEFKKLESEYNDFYKEIPTTANVYNLYIDKTNKLILIKKDKIHLNKYGAIRKDDAICMIQKNKKSLPNKKVELQTILTYNFTMDPLNILNMMTKEFIIDNYLTEINVLDDIVFKETVHFFSELNAIYFIYKERHTSNSTKKIHLRQQRKSNRRKTRYKRT